MQATQVQLIKEIKTIEYFDKRRYRFTFLNNTRIWITSVTTKLEEYREEGREAYREQVGTEEANRVMEEAGEWGSRVHHAAFLLATGGAVLYEPPAYQTVGIMNEEIAALIKQNNLVRQQLAVQNIPFLTINDQFRFLQVLRFKHWLDVVKPEVLYAEAVVYALANPNDPVDPIHSDIAGRLDFLFRTKEGHYSIAGEHDVYLPSGIVLPDLKSGKAWSKRFFYQMAAYRKAVKKSLGLEVESTVGIHVNAKTKTGLNTLVHGKEEADHDFTVWEYIAAIYDEKHKNDVPEEFEFESVILSDVARDAVMFGMTIPNKETEAKIGAELVEKINKAAEFQTDLAQATDIETEEPQPGTVDKTFLRKSHRRQ